MSGATRAQLAYYEAFADALATCEKLSAAGREDRAAGLYVAVDLGSSAAFLFDLSDRAYRDATNIVRQAIAQATREDNASS